MKLWLLFFILLIQNSLEVPELSDTRRIIGGRAGIAQNWKFMVSVRYKTRGSSIYTTCGGSLITTWFVLTAAHCLSTGESLWKEIYAAVGAYNMALIREWVRANHYIHYYYDEHQYKNDIALLKLSKPAILSSSVQLVKLSIKPVGEGTPCKVAGWGKNQVTAPYYSMPRVLRETDVNICPLDNCLRFFRMRQEVATHYCSDFFRVQGVMEGPYHGDSGGPLICNNEQVGVVSNGNHVYNARTGNVGYVMWTRVDLYHKWINETISRSSGEHSDNMKQRILSKSPVVTYNILLQFAMFISYLYLLC